MKFSSHITNKSVVLTFGLIMSILVLSQAVFVPISIPDQQEESSSQEEQQQIAPSVAVPSPSLQINLGYQSYLLGEIFQSEKTDLKTVVTQRVLLPTKKALIVLFRQIISPNAP